MPTPAISPSVFNLYNEEEKQGIINEAVEYQKLADILVEHPVIKLLLEETKGMDAVRA